MADATQATPVAAPAAPVAPAAPIPGSPEYNAAMVAKAEGTTPPATPAPAPESLILGKFKSPEDLAKAYTELEKRLGAQPPAQTPPATDPATPPANDPAKKPLTITPEADAAQKAVTNAGMDFDALAKEFAESGDLKPETYQSLEKAGIPKPMVDAYVAGQKALAEAYAGKAYAEAGGQQQFEQMAQWAAKSLPPADIAAFNAAVDSGNEAQMRMAVSGLKSRFAAQFGQPGDLVNGGNAPVTQGYRSLAEMKADMRDPRYAKDEAFRADVARKIDANPNLFNMHAVNGVR